MNAPVDVLNSQKSCETSDVQNLVPQICFPQPVWSSGLGWSFCCADSGPWALGWHPRSKQ